MFLYWKTCWSYLYPTHLYSILSEIFLCLFEGLKRMILYLFVCSLIAKSMKFLHCLHLLTTLRPIRNIENFFKVKCTGSPYNITDIIFLADIMNKKIGFRKFVIHCLLYEFLLLNHENNECELIYFCYIIWIFIYGNNSNYSGKFQRIYW